MTFEVAYERNSLGSDALGTRVVGWWETPGRAEARGFLKRTESFLPIARSISVFTGQPSNQIAVNKIEP